MTKPQKIETKFSTWTVKNAIKVKAGDRILIQPKDKRRKPVQHTVVAVYS